MPNDSKQNHPAAPLISLRPLELRLDSLYSSSSASLWGLTRSQFGLALERSVAKRFSEGPVSQQKICEYVETLHVEDLVLAAACMEGSESAWEHFVTHYRGYLRAVAGSITKGGRSGTDAQELADSIFAELFGLAHGQREEASLFRYFHGRSSLKTWLRTVLAQRHIDRIRQSRRWESIEPENDGEQKILSEQIVSTPSLDPHRNSYLQRFLLALQDALGELNPGDRKRLELYYAREKTLAEIGRIVGEHESSVSRHLERSRRELREKVEQCLRTGCSPADSRRLPPMSEAEIDLCFQYAAEDAPIDFRQMFPEKAPGKSQAGRKESL